MAAFQLMNDFPNGSICFYLVQTQAPTILLPSYNSYPRDKAPFKDLSFPWWCACKVGIN